MALPCLPAGGHDFPWGFLIPENDARDQEVRAFDEADSRNMVSVINASERPFGHRLFWEKVGIKNLLSAQVPFCEMRFDAVTPQTLTAREKTVLHEYLKRGGFILLFVDAYPYAQNEFWKIKEWPVITFLTKELPAADPGFSTGKAGDDFPVFKVHYKTETAEAIHHELNGNPNTPNRTVIFHDGRLCCFVMGRYYFLGESGWLAMPRPFEQEFSSDLKSYQLIVNMYFYSMIP